MHASMYSIKRFFFFPLLAFSISNIFGQEICGDGIDNDGDCNIDCNDFECGTSTIVNSNGDNADFAIGQVNFTDNSSGTSDSTFNNTYDIARDPTSNKIFVSDLGNHRVLRYNSLDDFLYKGKAEAVLGQVDFTQNSTGTSQNSFDTPTGIFVDDSGILWVTDWSNNRILRFDNASTKTNGANADGVLGQSNYTDDGDGLSQNEMSNPIDVVVEPDGTLWVADQNNRRVLRFDNASAKANGANADAVLGQADFVSAGVGPTQSEMGSASGLEIICNSLYVSDNSNNRILVWNNPQSKANGANADKVFGQSNYTSGGDGTSQNDLSGPRLLTSDKLNNLYVCDAVNNRILVFNEVGSKSSNANADLVLGQSNFTSNSSGTSQSELNNPRGIGVLATNLRSYLAVGDRSNNRIMVWGVTELEVDETANLAGFMPGVDNSGSGGLTFAITSSPSVGSVSLVNASTGEFNYIPGGECPLNSDSVVTFGYTVSNVNGCITNGEIAINVLNTTQCYEVCDNGIDDNGDGRIDEQYPGAIERNLILWLKAEQGFGGSAWEDQSRLNNDASFLGDPSLVNNGINFLPTVDFDGNDAVFTNLPELAVDGTPNHVVIFAVYKPDNNTTNQGIYGNQHSAGSSNININDGNVHSGNASGILSLSSLFADEVQLITWIIDEENLVESSSSRVYKDGTLVGTLNFDESSTSEIDNNFYIGSSGTHGSSQFFDGQFAEIIIYQSTNGNASLDATQKQKIESYLGLKYGVTISLDYVGSQ
ncbi:MAG: hypothetical protein AAF419_03530 [Pseudomonadota bacterium]